MKRPAKNYGKGWDVLVSPVVVLADSLGIPLTETHTNYGRLVLRWGAPEPGYDLEPGEMEQFRAYALAAETLSMLMCDVCGQPGHLRISMPDPHVRCDLHLTEVAP